MSRMDYDEPPLVSVAIITYNQADIIAHTLASVAAQTYKNLEIIIGDDASSDETPEVINQILAAGSTPYQLIRREKNIGITRNLNDVLSHCQGKYIALLGGDDLWLPEKVEVAISHLESRPNASFLCHGSIIIDGDGKETNGTLSPTMTGAYFSGLDAFQGKYPFYGSAQVLRNAQDLPIYEDHILYASDFIHTSVFIEQMGPGYAIPDLLTKYRKSPRGVTIGRRKQIQEDGLQGAMILAMRYPAYGPTSVARCAKIFYSNAVVSQKSGAKKDALLLARTSLLLKFRFKTFLRLILITLSRGQKQ